MEFKDISMEEKRVYHFASGKSYTVIKPAKLHVAESGSHRIEDAEGVLHYITPGFQAITITLWPGGKSGWSF